MGWKKHSTISVSRTIQALAAGLAMLIAAGQAYGLHPDEALSLSAETGRPVLVMATSATCPPCRALKRNLATHAEVSPLAKQYITLDMRYESADFQNFLRHYPAEYRGVPMVFIIRSDGAALYGQSGGMLPETLRDLLQFGLDESANLAASKIAASDSLASNEDVDDLSTSNVRSSESEYAANQSDRNTSDANGTEGLSEKLATAESHFHQGELLKALRLATFVRQTVDQRTDELIFRRSIDLRNSILDAAYDRLHKLDQRLASSDTMHGAAFRLAELYAELGDVPPRESAKSMLVHYQQQESTRQAVIQGKELVRARDYERRGCVDLALESYRRIVGLDRDSPTGDHAVQKLAIIQARQRGEMASRNSSF